MWWRNIDRVLLDMNKNGLVEMNWKKNMKNNKKYIIFSKKERIAKKNFAIFDTH